MAYYFYRAEDLKGNKLSGKFIARDEYELITTFRNEGYYIVNYKKIQKKINKIYFKGSSSYELSIFCKEFATLISSGIHLSEALQILREGNLDKKIKKSVAIIQERVQQGEELSTSMKEFSDVFPDFMINMISIGEQSGNLDYILNKLYEYYSKDHHLKSDIKKAMIYPCVVFCITCLIMALLILKVMPIFTDTYAALGAELPPLTLKVLRISTFLRKNFAVLLCALAAAITAVLCFKKTDKGKMYFDMLKLKMPFIGKINIKISAANFSRCICLLTGSGISIIKAMDIVVKFIGNKFVEGKLQSCTENIRKGNTIAMAVNTIGIFPPLLFSLVKVGEESGRLTEMLDKTAEIFYDEVYETIGKLTKLIEPALILLVSLMVGIIVAAVMLPMLTIMDKVAF